MCRSTLKAMLLAMIVIVFSASLLAQTTGTFLGTVTDPAGALVPNAKVTLTNERSGDVRQQTSNEVGRFTFAGVVPGNFTVKVEAQGFKTWRRTSVVMNAGDTRDISGIQLAVGSASDVVTVESTMGAVEVVDSGERAAVLSTKEIDNLGLIGRNVTELLKVLPGVNSVANGVNSGASGYNPMETGASGSYIGVGLSTNGAPYRGGTALLLDGANILDPGCACWSTASPNPEFTQEVKVQTSNFAAEIPNGPVIVNVASKYGTDKYHGSGYLFTRNGILNANDHSNNINSAKRPEESYYYPGGTFGGPIPFTNHKLLFWTGYEHYWQKTPGTGQLTSWIPTSDMLAGNFGPTAANLAMCPNGMGAKDDGTLCAPVTGFAANGTSLTNASNISQYLNPTVLAMLKAYLPAPNVTPSAANGYANYFLAYSSQHNGYLFRQRLDYNLSENTKLYASYQYGNDNTTTLAHMWWTPGSSIPYPGGAIGNPHGTHTLSTNFLKVFSPTLTNEAQGTWQLYLGPFTADSNKISKSAVSWNIGSYYGGSDPTLPSLNGPWGNGGPVMDQPDLFQNGGFPTQKISYSFGDTVTKVYQNHTLKAGVRYEKNGNLQADFVFPNGELTYGTGARSDQSDENNVGTGNPLANLLMGVFTGYQETNKLPTYDLDYKNYSFFGQDDWKVTKRLTLNIGARFERIGRWYDNTGAGLAVWLPGRYAQDVTTGKAFPGVYWHGIDPGIPVSGAPNPGVATSPRLGMAFDVFGNGKTVIRGGWGQYRWQDQFNDYGGDVQAGMGVQTYHSNGSFNVTMADLVANAGKGKTATTTWSPSSVNVADPNDHKTGTTTAWNFTLSQHLPWTSLLEVAYVGNETTNLMVGGQSAGTGVVSGYTNQNKVAAGALFTPDPVTGVIPADPEQANVSHYQPYAAYGGNAINMNQHLGWANYNALQVAWVKKGAHANVNLNYTWSKALGLVTATVDPYNLHNDYGVLNIDRPHAFNASYSYEFGRAYKGDSKLIGGAINGWTIAGTTTFQSGANLQAQADQALNMVLHDNNRGPIDPKTGKPSGEDITSKTYFGAPGMEILPILSCDPFANLSGKQGINMNCVAAPALGKQGQMQLGYLAGPIYWNSDLSAYKSFKITEGQNLQFRFSAFNFLNHGLLGYNNNNQIQPKFNLVNGAWVNNNSGNGVLNTVNGRRVVELGLKYSF